jgi:hypothetical protein
MKSVAVRKGLIGIVAVFGSGALSQTPPVAGANQWEFDSHCVNAGAAVWQTYRERS